MSTLKERFDARFGHVHDDVLPFVQAELLLLAEEAESLKYPTEETSGHAAHNQTIDIVTTLIRSKAADLL